MSDAEINWKRFCFHGNYFLNADIQLVNDDQLIIREVNYLTVVNPALANDVKTFKAMQFNKQDTRFLVRDRLGILFIAIFALEIV